MKKFILAMICSLFFISCTTKNEVKNSLWVFFPDSTITYSGGFENSNYTIVTQKYSKDLVIQKIETTGTVVTKAIKVDSTSATIVFLGENIENYKEDMNNMERVILKLPLKNSTSWESDENSFIIKSYDGKILNVIREFDGGKIETTYEAGTGMINESFSSEGFSKTSKIIKKN